MRFYPDVWAAEGASTPIPNLLVAMSFAKSWAVRAASNPAVAQGDGRPGRAHEAREPELHDRLEAKAAVGRALRSAGDDFCGSFAKSLTQSAAFAGNDDDAEGGKKQSAGSVHERSP
jgi:hypothetical protein